MKKFLTLMLGITMATVLFTGCKKKNNNAAPEEAPSETTSSEMVPSVTTPSEIKSDESKDSSSIAKEKSVNESNKEVQKNFSQSNQNKNNYNANDFTLKNLGCKEYNNNQLGMKYVAPDGLWIVPQEYADAYGDSISKSLETFYENGKMEFMCISEDGTQGLCMFTGKLKDMGVPLDDLFKGDRTICGKSFKDVPNSVCNVYCSKVGNNVVIISTTSNDLLAGFKS